MNNKVYQYFYGEVIQLTPQIVNQFLSYSKTNNFFLIRVKTKKTRLLYEQLFKKYDYDDYVVFGDKNISLFKFFKCILYDISHPLLTLRRQVIIDYLDFKSKSFWLEFTGNNIVAHGEICQIGYGFLKIISDKKIKKSWVCWGGIPKVQKYNCLNKWFKASYYDYKYIKDCRLIFSLTNCDKNEINNRYNIKSAVYCPYIPLSISPIKANKNNNILIGNSAHYLKEYKDIVNVIKHIKGINLTFMVNYGVSSQNELDSFKEYCNKELNGINIYFWDKIVAYKDYMSFVSKHSVYICGVERQTGLGALFYSISSGLKTYCCGVNYEEVSSLGLKVHHISELRNIKDVDILTSCSEEEINHNTLKMKEINNPNMSSEKWDYYLSQMSY